MLPSDSDDLESRTISPHKKRKILDFQPCFCINISLIKSTCQEWLENKCPRTGLFSRFFLNQIWSNSGVNLCSLSIYGLEYKEITTNWSCKIACDTSKGRCCMCQRFTEKLTHIVSNDGIILGKGNRDCVLKMRLAVLVNKAILFFSVRFQDAIRLTPWAEQVFKILAQESHKVHRIIKENEQIPNICEVQFPKCAPLHGLPRIY